MKKVWSLLIINNEINKCYLIFNFIHKAFWIRPYCYKFEVILQSNDINLIDIYWYLFMNLIFHQQN